MSIKPQAIDLSCGAQVTKKNRNSQMFRIFLVPVHSSPNSYFKVLREKHLAKKKLTEVNGYAVEEGVTISSSIVDGDKASTVFGRVVLLGHWACSLLSKRSMSSSLITRLISQSPPFDTQLS